MARLRSQPQESEDSETDVDVCVVCQQQSQRVTVSCAACTKLFHLGCHTPALRRRPQLADAWQCSGCKEGGEGAKKHVTSGKRKRREMAKDEKEQEAQPTPKRCRVSMSSTQKEDEDEKQIAKTPTTRQNGKAVLKKKKAKPRADGRTARRASSRKAVVQLSDDEDNEDEDNDGDSDFVGESVPEEDEDDNDDKSASADVSSDEDNRKPARRRLATKKSPAKQKNGVNRRAKQKAAASSHVAANNSVDVSDADSLDIDIVGESESSDDEDVYEGPHYFIEYAANGRAKVSLYLCIRARIDSALTFYVRVINAVQKL